MVKQRWVSPCIQSMTNVAMSGSGQYILVASISSYDYTATGTVYMSNNYGASWKLGPVPYYTDTTLTVSVSGQYMHAIPARVGAIAYYSSDYGATWNIQSIPGSFAAFAANSTGQFLAACSFGTVYTSFNSGKKWTTTAFITTTVGCSAMSMSSSGDSIYITFSAGSPVNGMMMKSTNYGRTWFTVPGTSSLGYSSIACDQLCDDVVTAVNQGGLYVSNNGGSSWMIADDAVVSIPSSSSDNEFWTAGVIAGVVIGVVVFVALLAAAVVWLMGGFAAGGASAGNATSQPKMSKDQVEIVNPITLA
jgi:hypothetical protein